MPYDYNQRILRKLKMLNIIKLNNQNSNFYYRQSFGEDTTTRIEKSLKYENDGAQRDANAQNQESARHFNQLDWLQFGIRSPITVDSTHVQVESSTPFFPIFHETCLDRL